MLEFRDRLLRLLSQEREHEATDVASGAASSFDDYRHRIGRIAAFDRAGELINEAFRGYVHEDDDDGA
jgi:hypothetical protein